MGSLHQNHMNRLVPRSDPIARFAKELAYIVLRILPIVVKEYYSRVSGVEDFSLLVLNRLEEYVIPDVVLVKAMLHDRLSRFFSTHIFLSQFQE